MKENLRLLEGKEPQPRKKISSLCHKYDGLCAWLEHVPSFPNLLRCFYHEWVPVTFLLPWWNTTTKSNLGGKDLFGLLIPISPSWRSQNRNSRQDLESGTEAETVKEFFLVCLPCLLYNPGLPTSIIIQENTSLTFWWEHFLTWVSSSHTTLASCQVGRKQKKVQDLRREAILT